MRKRVFSVFLIVALIFSGTLAYFAVAYGESPLVVYARELPFYGQMVHQLAKYKETSDWMCKIHPLDREYLEKQSWDSVLYVDVYVLNPKESVAYSIDRTTGEVVAKFYVYVPREEHVKELLQIPHSSFLVSTHAPSVGMDVEKRYIPEIARLPFVYCIRVLRPMTTYGRACLVQKWLKMVLNPFLHI